MDQCAIGIELPAMVAAGQPRHAPGVTKHEPVPAMGASVVERLDAAIGLLDHDNRFLAEVMAHKVALFLELSGDST